jgi:hypothetical protein
MHLEYAVLYFSRLSQLGDRSSADGRSLPGNGAINGFGPPSGLSK